jgi:hypothetical protein
MVETPNQQRSRFIASFRLKPSRSFAGLQAQITTGDGYELSFRDDMVWIRFDATSDEWLRRLDVGTQALKTLLATLTIQTEYPFDLEPIQWIEDKSRDETRTANYVLGRLGPDLTVQKEPPPVRIDSIQKGEIHAHLASHNAYYRYGLLDYSVALSLPWESIVFCARAVEWVESYFDVIKRSLPKQRGLGARKLMKDKLKLPGKYLDQFFTVANETVIARHAGDPNRIRSPKIDEIRFCVFFSRVVLDRFGLYLWHLLSSHLPAQWKYPPDERPPAELLEANNPSLIKSLEQILNRELS